MAKCFLMQLGSFYRFTLLCQSYRLTLHCFAARLCKIAFIADYGLLSYVLIICD